MFVNGVKRLHYYVCLFIIICLKEAEDQVQVEEGLDNPVPNYYSWIGGRSECRVVKRGDAGVGHQQQDEYIQAGLYRVIHANHKLVHKRTILVDCYFFHAAIVGMTASVFLLEHFFFFLFLRALLLRIIFFLSEQLVYYNVVRLGSSAIKRPYLLISIVKPEFRLNRLSLARHKLLLLLFYIVLTLAKVLLPLSLLFDLVDVYNFEICSQ